MIDRIDSIDRSIDSLNYCFNYRQTRVVLAAAAAAAAAALASG